MSTQHKHLEQLSRAIVHKPPYCSGTVPVQDIDTVIFYGRGEEARRLTAYGASSDALEHLSQTCAPATFGMNQQDVLDESYRKAGALSNSDFAVKLDLHQSGLMDIISTQLLEGSDAQKSIYAELYKLNVYREGSFFKSHKDTPRGGTMFGSLVIVYPTSHEGGSLIFREGEAEWTFDSAQAVAEHEGSPCVAYATFFSDVDHEVAMVSSGYRLTVTYNLYVVDSTPALATPPSSNRLLFKSAFEHVLKDPTFLPEGGYLGFGLRHVYPLERKPKKTDTLDYLKNCLKGSDANLIAVCRDLLLEASIWMLYSDAEGTVIVPKAPNVEGAYMESDLSEYLETAYNAKKVGYRKGKDIVGSDSVNEEICKKYPDQSLRVHWVTKPSSLNVLKSSYIAYGNDADLVYAYGYFTLIVKVGGVNERATRKD